MLGEIKLYTADWCNGCKKVKVLLDSCGIDYEVLDISNSENLKSLSDLGIKSIPVVCIGDQVIVGSSEESLLTLRIMLGKNND